MGLFYILIFHIFKPLNGMEERILKYNKEYYLNNKAKILARQKKYLDNKRNKFGRIELTESQKEAKKINDKKYREKIKSLGTRKKLTLVQKEKRKLYLEKYRKEKKDFLKEKASLFYKKRKEEGKIDLEKQRIKREIYYKNNRDKIRKTANSWDKNKRKTCSLYVVKSRIRGRMSAAFKNVSKKKPLTSNKLIGTTWEICKNHLESLFKEGMNWDNKHLWHIDHIIPLSSAKTEEDMIKLCHYTNLQPLWARENQSKNNKILTQYI